MIPREQPFQEHSGQADSGCNLYILIHSSRYPQHSGDLPSTYIRKRKHIHFLCSWNLLCFFTVFISPFLFIILISSFYIFLPSTSSFKDYFLLVYSSSDDPPLPLILFCGAVLTACSNSFLYISRTYDIRKCTTSIARGTAWLSQTTATSLAEIASCAFSFIRSQN